MRELNLDEVSSVNGAAAAISGGSNSGSNNSGSSNSGYHNIPKQGFSLAGGSGAISAGDGVSLKNGGLQRTNNSRDITFGAQVSGGTKGGVSKGQVKVTVRF